jgi:hypothetical protein
MTPHPLTPLAASQTEEQRIAFAQERIDILAR